MRAIIPILALVGCEAAPWTHADTARELAYLGESAIDYSQSRQITARCKEENPLIGKCGEYGLAPYMLATSVLHVAISALLPYNTRLAWQYITLGSEGSTVVSNHLAHY